MSNTVFFFGYSWNIRRTLDAYQSSIVEELSNQGFDVRVYQSNLYSNRDSLGIFPIFESQMIREIKKYKPTIVVSMNQGLLEKICNAVPAGAPIYTWIVDDSAHFFYPDTLEKMERPEYRLHHRVKVIVFSSYIYKFFQENYKELRPENLRFTSSVSNYSLFRANHFKPEKNIVFVGSYLDTTDALIVLREACRNKQLRALIMSVLRKMSVNYFDDSYPEYTAPEVVDFLRRQHLSFHQFKHTLSNLLSNNIRLEGVRVLKDLGLEVYGNFDWINGLYHELDSLDCFQSEKISSRQDLVKLYQSSKISIQLSQVQVGPALSYRIFDILASDSLLIHPYHPDSDLYHFFGKDCPVPMYRDFAELRSLCQYYLEHEEERQELVKKCQALVREGYSFSDRVREMLGDRVGAKVPGRIFDEHRRRLKISVWGTALFAARFFFEHPGSGITLIGTKLSKMINKFRGKDDFSE